MSCGSRLVHFPNREVEERRRICGYSHGPTHGRPRGQRKATRLFVSHHPHYLFQGRAVIWPEPPQTLSLTWGVGGAGEGGRQGGAGARRERKERRGEVRDTALKSQHAHRASFLGKRTFCQVLVPGEQRADHREHLGAQPDSSRGPRDPLGHFRGSVTKNRF